MRRATVTTIAALALAVTACGGEPEPAATPTPVAFPAGTVEVVGTASVAWEHTELQAESVDGALAVTLICDGGVPHNLLIEGVADDAGADRVLAECNADESATVDVEVPTGDLVFYCSVPGHRNAGMEGVLTVAAAAG